MNSKKFLNNLNPPLFIIGVLTVVSIVITDPQKIESITKEDGIIESLTAIFFLLGFLFCAFLAFRGARSPFLILWCLLCLIFLGEETSWFQRIFSYSIPIIEDINRQNEFNIHNLQELYEEPMVTEDGGYRFPIKALLKPQNLMKIGFFLYFLVVPLLHQIPKLRRYFQMIGYPKPMNGFLIAIWPVLLLSYVFTFLFNQVNHSIVETREMFYALYILIYIIGAFLSLNVTKTKSIKQIHVF